MSCFMPSELLTFPENETGVQILEEARRVFTQEEISQYLDVSTKTIRRWEKNETAPKQLYLNALHDMLHSRSNNNTSPDFTFIDLFAGIGGMRLAFESAGGKCVFTSEWDSFAQKTYRANFTIDHDIWGDIQKLDKHSIPEHDVLVGGFPCQPFSIAGVSKKNSLGKKHGFLDETQGTLFFDILQIIRAKRPKAFLLENVKNLVSHDKGRTFRVIINALIEAGYTLGSSGQFHRIIDGKHFVPQHRERTFIVGFVKETNFSWDEFSLPALEDGPRLSSILHPEDGTEEAEEPYTTGRLAKVSDKYVLSDKLWKYLQNYAEKHRAKGNGFGFGLVTPSDTSRTLSARYYKDGSEILINRGQGKNPRRLTPRECSRLMGYDSENHKMVIPVSDTRAYKQFGNGVVVPVVKEIARIMKPHILSLKGNKVDNLQRYLTLSVS